MRFGRMYQGVVVSVMDVPPGRTIEQHVGYEQAENYQDLPDWVGVGYKQDIEGGWHAPKVLEPEGVKA